MFEVIHSRPESIPDFSSHVGNYFGAGICLTYSDAFVSVFVFFSLLLSRTEAPSLVLSEGVIQYHLLHEQAKRNRAPGQ